MPPKSSTSPAESSSIAPAGSVPASASLSHAAATSPNDCAYWVAVRRSTRGTLDLIGPFTLYDAFDASDKLKRQHGKAAQVSSAYRAESRAEALKNAAYYVTRC